MATITSGKYPHDDQRLEVIPCSWPDMILTMSTTHLPTPLKGKKKGMGRNICTLIIRGLRIE